MRTNFAQQTQVLELQVANLQAALDKSNKEEEKWKIQNMELQRQINDAVLTATTKQQRVEEELKAVKGKWKEKEAKVMKEFSESKESAVLSTYLYAFVFLHSLLAFFKQIRK